MSRKIATIHTLVFLFIVGCTPTPISEKAITKSNDNERTISVLNNLIQIDIDSYYSYTQAMEALKSQQLVQTLKAFRSEHEHHIKVLSKIVLARGGIPPEFSRDFVGYLLSGYTAIKVKGSVHSILQAMENNEALCVMHHHDALKIDLPANVRKIVQMQLDLAINHLACIREMKKGV